MTNRSEADVLLHKTQYNTIIDSIRASRRGVGWVLLFAAIALLFSGTGIFILAQTVSANQQTISELKTELKISGKGAEAEAIAPAAEVDQVTIFGKPGKDGKDGRDGTDGTNGRDGSNGVAGADGKQGKPGQPGRVGAAGTPGAPGKPGRDGRDGTDGAPGKDGKPGLRGEPGHGGPPGPAGKDGKDGVDGKDGKDASPLPVFVIDIVQGGQCSITVMYSDNTNKAIDLC